MKKQMILMGKEIQEVAMRSSKSDRVGDIIVISFICLVAVLLNYHPYFFGDELSAKHLAIVDNFSITKVFSDLNQYKPRFVFNAMMATVGGLDLGRNVLAIITGGSLALFCIFLYFLALRLSDNNRILALLLPIAVVLSRFGQTFYFDYVAGSIELLSALFMILTVFGVLRVLQTAKPEWRILLFTLIAELCCVFVHERYAVGFFFMGIGLVVANFRSFWPVSNPRLVFFTSFFTLAPGLLFWLSNQVWGHNDILLASAGKSATIDFSSIQTFLLYCFNVVLNGNWGDPWFWGSVNFSSTAGFPVGIVSVALTVILLIFLLLAKGVYFSKLQQVLPLLFLAFGLLAIGSLTGADRMEARFAYVPSILLVLTSLVLVKGWFRLIPLGLVIAINLVYLVLGSSSDIANIYSSRASKGLATSLASLKPSGDRGLIIGNDSDNTWTFANGENFSDRTQSVHTYSRLNLKNGMTIEPYGLRSSYSLDDYDFALVFTGFQKDRVPYYKIMTPVRAFVLKGLLSVDQLPIDTSLGETGKWMEWRWNVVPESTNKNILLKAGMEGFFPVRAGDLRDKYLVYRVRSLQESPVTMRMQVNWQIDDQFLSTSISLLSVGKDWQNGVKDIEVPIRATTGLIYLQLHDGESGVVEVESVNLR